MKTKRLLYVGICIIVSVLFSIPVMAAYKQLNPYEGELAERCTVNGAVFSVTSKSYTVKSLAVTKNGQTHTLSTKYDGGIISDGKTAYFCEIRSGKWCLCKANISTGKVIKIKPLAGKKNRITLEGIYKNKIYYIKNMPEGDLYCINLKTKKVKRLLPKKCVSSAQQIKQYFVMSDGTGAGFSYLGVYNAKNGKFSTVSKNPFTWTITSKYIYYVEGIGNVYMGSFQPKNVTVKRYTLSSKKKKTLVKTLTIQYTSGMGFQTGADAGITTNSLKYYDKNGKKKTKRW